MSTEVVIKTDFKELGPVRRGKVRNISIAVYKWAAEMALSKGV